MKKTWNEDSICEFLSAVEEIPAGIIASYVRIARRPAGWQSAAHGFVFYGSYPSVNRKGRLIPHFREPRKVRPPEGVIFLPDGSVDVKNISGTAEAANASPTVCI